MRHAASHARPQRDVPAAPTNAPRFLAVVVLLAAAVALVHPLWEAPEPPSPTAASLFTPAPPPTASPARPLPLDTPTPSPTPTPSRPLPIGIVAGHSGSRNGIEDPGAICSDGLREVDINLEIAHRVVNYLRAYGYEVDLLQEYDARAEGYHARALVSIHADSCTPPYASGFKVARAVDSAIPEVEDRLVDCLVRQYQTRTGLDLHEWSITPDMTEYHIFYKIDRATPAVIIEVGFMGGDRDLLVDRPDLVAEGVAEGIRCFVEDNAP